MEQRPKKPTNKGPAEWFTGDVWIDPIAQGQPPSKLNVGALHFTPGRTHCLALPADPTQPRDTRLPLAQNGSLRSPVRVTHTRRYRKPQRDWHFRTREIQSPDLRLNNMYVVSGLAQAEFFLNRRPSICSDSPCNSIVFHPYIVDVVPGPAKVAILGC